MFNSDSTIRSILVFGLCVLLAVFLGYIVASPLDRASLAVYGLVFFVLAVPILLRWHHPIMIGSWQMNAVVFLLPGHPPFWMAMVGISILFSVAHFALNREEKYLAVGPIIRPLLFLAAVVLITAKMRGGIGLQTIGGDVAGGKRYIFLLAGILGYFALSCRPIPKEKAYFYGSLLFLGGLTAIISSSLPLVNPAFYIIFAIFPPEHSGFEALGLVQQSEVFRLGGLSSASIAICCALLACYGIKGIFSFSSPLSFVPFAFRGGFRVNRPWRLTIFILAFSLGLVGGYRSHLILLALTFAAQFYYEKLFHTRLFPALVVATILAAAVTLPMADKLPLSIQRTLSFLPVEVDPVAKASADGSTEWRLTMWKLVLPEVPQYFFLGKGYAMNSSDLEFIAARSLMGRSDSMETAMLAGDYHSGPLSVIIPFGIFGVIGFLWFVVASIKVLTKNYRHGDPALTNINRFLLAYFVARTIQFFLVFGSFYSEMMLFTGIVGLSVALNGGVQTRNSSQIRLAHQKELVEQTA